MSKRIVIADLRGGRNDTDPPMSLPPNQAVECLNIDWKDATLGRKRGGATAVSQTGGTALSSGVQTLARHVPGASETAAELWAVDGAATPIVKRLTGGTTWADVTLDDAIATKPAEVVAASLNGKLFLAYDSTVDRLHVYDPSLASPRVRRVNIDPGASAPTVANTGAGAYAAVIRYYRIRWTQISGSTTVRRSEPTPVVSFTPSGAGTAARITRPTLPGEGETHWIVEASTDNAVFYSAFGPFTAATTIYDDSAAVSAYAGTPSTEVSGSFALFPSVKYLISDGNRLLGAGSWETAGTTSGGKNSRVWFTPVLGTTDRGDDERVVNTTAQKNYFDLNENDGGGVTGLGGPINGIPYGFKYRSVHKLRPTGEVTAPYSPRKVRDDIGCVEDKTIAMGEDQYGRPALYFLSHRGPYRITYEGDVQYLGRDNEVTWRSMNLGATTTVAHSTYYPDLHQWWLWIATGSANAPDVKMVLDVQLGFPDEHNQIRGGWAKHTGDSAGANCSCLFSNTLGASMSRDLKPHIGRSTGTTIFKCDTSDLDDNGAAVQAYAKSKPIVTLGDLGANVRVDEPYLLAKVQAATTVAVTLDRDFGAETRANTAVSLAAAGTESRRQIKVEGLEMAGAGVIQIQVGDNSAVASAWTLDALVIPVTPEEAR